MPAGANQQDLTALSLEELLTVDIINAARLGQKPSEAPSSITTLTARDIRTFGWRTLAEALNAMRGLYVTNDRNYSYLGVRGMSSHGSYNSRVLLMIDGQRMNENIFDGGYVAQEFMLDIDLIERIEFIPGSGSSIYGANAFYGLINVVTKQGNAINGTQVAGEIGSFDTYKTRASFGKKLDNGLDMLLSASHFDTQGVENLYFSAFDTPSNNQGVAHNMDDEHADRLFARFQYQDFSLMGGFVDRFKRVPTAAFGAIFNDPDFYTNDRQFFGNVKYKKDLNADSTLSMKGFYQGYDYDADQPYAADNQKVINVDGARGRWWGGELQLTTTAWERHRLLVGLEYQYDQRQEQWNFDLSPYTRNLHSNSQGDRVELFAQDDIRVLDDLIFSAGLRLDQHHMLDGLQLNPRFGLIWNPLSSTTYKLLYSSSFRAPNVFERDYQLGSSNLPNPYLREERIKSYEAIAEWHDDYGLKLTSNLFYNAMQQLLDQQSEPLIGNYGRFYNSGKAQSFGFELEAEKRWATGRQLKASYVFSRMEEEHANGHGHDSPYNLFKLHYAEPLFNDFARLGIENIFVDERLTYQSTMADAFDQLNMQLTSDKLLKGLDVSLGVYNLLDTHYRMLGGSGLNDVRPDQLPMNGRELRLKLLLTF